MTREHRMYGRWESPITAKSLASMLRLSEPCWDTDGRTIGWVEGRSDRGVLVVQDADGGAPRDLTSDISVRAFLGYGGGDFTLSHGAAYFVGQADQRIYRQPLAGGPPRPITPAFGAASSPAVSPDGRWLAYVASYDHDDCIAIVDTEGKYWPQRLATGRDFYMQPVWSPSGDRLAWVEWDHPNMPWDGTELALGALAFAAGLPTLAETEIAAGGRDVSVFQPAFAPDGSALFYVSDEPGSWHLFRRDLRSGAVRQLTSGGGEFGQPAWQQGQRSFCVLPSGAVVGIRNENAFNSLVLVDEDGTVADLAAQHPEYSAFSWPAASPAASSFACVATSSAVPPRIVVFEVEARRLSPSVRRRSDGETIPPSMLSQPEAISWTSFDGETAHGLYYPPASARFEGSGRPPLIVTVHGGPTSQVTASYGPQTQFFATRGYAVLQVNYRGSTGYGREYMLKLRNSWGIYDVRDSQAGAQALADRGLADPAKLVIMGGSAGGFTVLQSLVELPHFYKAGLCLFGVANMFTLASDTHKFEERYLDTMLGPLPEAAAVYRERSPIFHASRIVDPIAVFQGEIDRVVPREQSDSIVASLRARGVPHEYHLYEGEGHGWRKAETIEKFYASVERFLTQYVLFA